MFFQKTKPGVTPDDKDWAEEAMLWFEEQYGKDFLKNVEMIEPTKDFFPLEFKGTKENAQHITELLCDYMQIKDVAIDLHYFSDRPIELTEGIFVQKGRNQNNYSLGTYRQRRSKIAIGVEEGVLKDPISLIATLAHELSHYVLLGEGRLEKNNEELTDMNTIALGLGIFTANTAFKMNLWQGQYTHSWQAERQGYVPQEVVAYGLALLANYQQKEDLNWTKHLDTPARKMFDKNMKYLKTTADEVKFK